MSKEKKNNNPHNLVRGQKCLVLNCSGYDNPVPATITTVGRRYATVTLDSTHRTYKMFLTTLVQVTSVGYPCRLFLDGIVEYKRLVARDKMMDNIATQIRRHRGKCLELLTDDELKNLESIIKKSNIR